MMLRALPFNKRWLIKLIGPLIFIVILTQIDREKAFSLFPEVRFDYLALFCFVLFPLSLIIRSYKWNVILENNGIRFSLAKAIGIYYIGMATNIVLPANVGAFSKTYYLLREGHPLSVSVLVTAYDKVFEIVAIIAISLLTLIGIPLSLYGHSESMIHRIAIMSLILILILISLFTLRRYIFHIGGRICQPFLKRCQNDVLLKEYNALRESLLNIKALQALYLVALSFVIKTIEYSMVYVLAVALHIPGTFFAIFFCANIAALVSFLPVSYNGIGLRDATFYMLFPLFGIYGEFGVSLAIMLLFLSMFLQSLGFLCLYKYPLVHAKDMELSNKV